MTKKLILTPLTILLASTVFGQQRLEVEIGPEHVITRDYTVSSLIYSGRIPAVGTSLLLERDKAIHHFQIHVGNGNIENRIENIWQVMSISVSNYSAYRIPGKPIIETVGVGMGMVSFLYTPQFHLKTTNFKTDREIKGYLSAYLGAVANTGFRLTDKWKLELEGILPFVEYNIRSGYSTSTPDQLINKGVHSFGEFIKAGSFNLSIKQPQVLIEINLLRRNEKKMSYKLGYSFSYRSNQDPLEISLVKQNLKIGATWQW